MGGWEAVVLIVLILSLLALAREITTSIAYVKTRGSKSDVLINQSVNMVEDKQLRKELQEIVRVRCGSNDLARHVVEDIEIAGIWFYKKGTF